MSVTLCWFRQDLRLEDNPALAHAASVGKVLPVYILDDENAGEDALGSASRWWLHHALCALNDSLNQQLQVFTGKPLANLLRLCEQYNVTTVCWNRCYEPWSIKRDKHIKQQLQEHGVEVKSFNGSLLWEPWTILKKDKTPYQVFTPFYQKGCGQAPPPRQPLTVPRQLQLVSPLKEHQHIDALALLPTQPWPEQLAPHWEISEHGAQQLLSGFLKHRLHEYQTGRDFPSRGCVSRLSPYLQFGQLSPHQVWYDTYSVGDHAGIDSFRRELGWREFSHYVLYHNPNLPYHNLRTKFDTFPWQKNPSHIAAWQRGLTGYPFVDAGMRELWQTGYMHNRVRMVAASFLVKNLLIDWREGARWFWDCLVDASLANNSINWQWVAGTGIDAAPYFRIFNPITQGQKFDPEGNYIRQYVPELAQLPTKYLFAPWLAPADILARAHVQIGKSYPLPIVDLRATRERALAIYAQISS